MNVISNFVFPLNCIVIQFYCNISVGVSYFVYYICIYLRILFSPHDFHIREEEVTKGLTKSSTSKTDNAMAKTKDHTDP